MSAAAALALVAGGEWRVLGVVPLRGARVVEAFPWIERLPDDEQVECVEALLRRLRAGAEAGVLAPFTQLVHGWRQTAALHADPRLAADLSRPLPGDGPLLGPPA